MGVKGEERLTVSLPVSGVSVEMKAAPVIGRKTGPSRRSTKGGWTGHEDELLREAVTKYNGRNWKKIAEYFPNRTDVQCLHRWQKVLDPQLIKGPWTKEEDDLIMELVKKYGCTKWSFIAKSLPGRIGKQCRERWHNQLDPSITKEPWTREEEAILISAHQIYGNKWAEIAKQLPGRADNAIKNHWNCSVKKRLAEYPASRIPIQQQGVPIVDPSIYASQERCSTTDRVAKRTTNPALAVPKLAGDRHLMTSNVNLVRQSATRGRLNLDLQLVPPGDSKCQETKFRPALPVPELTRERHPKTFSTDFVDRSTTQGTPNLDLELVPPGDSKCQEISNKSSSVEDFKCIRREGGESVLKQRPPMENHHCLPFKKRVIATPCISGVYGKTNFGDGDLSERFKETTLSSSLICNLSDTDRLEDQAPSTPGNSGSLCAADLQLKDTKGYVSESFKETILSSSLACNPSNIDRLEDQAPATPLYCTKGNSGFLYDTDLQLKDTKGSISNLRLSESKGNVSVIFKEAALSSSLACNPSDADRLDQAPTTPLFCIIGSSGYSCDADRQLKERKATISDKLFSESKGYVSESFKETTLSSSLACNPSDTDRLDDQAPTTPLYCASGNSGSLGDTDLQLKDTKGPISGKLFSDSKGYVSRSFKETTLSSSFVCNPSDTDRLGNQAPITPLYSAKENSGSLCDAPVQLKDNEGSISDKLFLESKGYDRKAHSKFHCFTPADCILPSPLAVLRSLAKTFETPSIIRKRVYQSSEPVSTVVSHKEIASAKDSSRVGDIYVNAKRVRNTLDSACAHKNGEINLADFDKTRLNDDDRSSQEYSKHSISGATKSLARKLENDFNLIRADLRPRAR